MFKTNTDITILRPERKADGAVSYTEIPSRALRIDLAIRSFSDLPAECDDTVFLVPPPELPGVEDAILCAGRHYDLKSVRLCRGIDGGIVAARCLAAGRRG